MSRNAILMNKFVLDTLKYTSRRLRQRVESVNQSRRIAYEEARRLVGKYGSLDEAHMSIGDLCLEVEHRMIAVLDKAEKHGREINFFRQS